MRLPGTSLLFGAWLSLCCLVVGTVKASEPVAEIVVANRYLQQAGTSHSHLYLYRADGRLLRQLTKDDSGQDRNPVFAPDGETIVFTRELPKGSKQWWSIEPLGKNLRQLDALPEWYTQAKTSPAFDHYFGRKDGDIPETPEDEQKRVYPFRDDGGTTDVVLTPTKEAIPEHPDEWNALLRTADGKEAKLGILPGWSPGVLGCRGNDGEKNALSAGTLQVAFLATSLGSTDGTIVHAISLDGKRLVRLARNWASPVPLPGEPAFLASAEERYVPFGDGSHTANCQYVDLWDAALKRVRYARPDTAAICYGASMYRPGKSPAAITIRAGEE